MRCPKRGTFPLNQINLEDNSQFYYTISPYELTNALGNGIALLQGIIFLQERWKQQGFTCKIILHKMMNFYHFEHPKRVLK